MFDALSEKFDSVLKQLRGEARLTEENIREAMREVRVALLDADVNFKVVKDFTRTVTDKAVGEETLKSVRPGEQIVKIVNDELVEMMGREPPKFEVPKGAGVNVILLLGLQGAGKTTFAGKLAAFCKKHGYKPLIIAADVYRPAAIRQAQVVGENVGVPVFEMGTETPVPEIARRGLEEARRLGRDLVIVDTAGRLHLDEVKMDELVEVKKLVNPRYTFLVADAMTGQDAVNSASGFNEGVGIDGVCLTKIDGDARGGAALSIRAVTGKPIYFVGTGERPDDLEIFYPDRIASRILGMGDIVSLVERAQETIDEKEALDLQRKMKREEFTLQDFMDQMQKVKKMGSLKSLMKMIPGMGAAMQGLDELDDDAFKPMEALIQSMTPEERDNPDLIEVSRRKRIARGSGRTEKEVKDLLDQFKHTRKMMGTLMRMGPKEAAAAARGMQSGGGAGAAAALQEKVKPKHRRKTTSGKQKTKERKRKRRR